MKRIFTILGLFGILCISCSDYIEEENLSNVTAESFYTTSEGYESLINANYSILRNLYGNSAYIYCSGTDMYAPGRQDEPIGLSQYTELNASSGGGINTLYNTCYRAIQEANMAIYYSDLTERTDNLNTYVGEVKYLRANAYFLLVQTFGGVGLVNEYINRPILEFDRNSAEEVYDFIISELNESLSMVGSGAYNGRVNKRAVRHLLSKVYLTRGYEDFGESNDFTMAASLADETIAGQELTIPFDELWAAGNEMNAEVLFSVQYDAVSLTHSPTGGGNQQQSNFGPYTGGAEFAGDAIYKFYNLCPTNYAIGLFEQEDERYDVTFMDEVYQRYLDFYDVEDKSTINVAHYFAPKWASSSDLEAYSNEHPTAVIHPFGTYGPSAGNSNDYGTVPVKKFEDPGSPWGQSSSRRDFILSRLGETYLIAAEAYLQAGDPAKGLERLNAVRDRAGVPDATLAEFDIDFLLDERGRELLGEYHRWFDLKRTGTLVRRASQHHFLIEEGNFVGKNGNLKILRPIPQEALNLNQNNDFPQNPAYD